MREARRSLRGAVVKVKWRGVDSWDAPALAYSTENCTVGRTMAILGERWTVVVLRELFLGFPIARPANVRVTSTD